MENNEPVIINEADTISESSRKIKPIRAAIFIAGILLLAFFVFFIWTKIKGPSVRQLSPEAQEQKLRQEAEQWKANLNQIAGRDKDFDNLTDEDELKYGTDPGRPDTDGDGMLDGDEAQIFKTNPLKADTDGDGIKDGTEIRRGADPLKKDK